MKKPNWKYKLSDLYLLGAAIAQVGAIVVLFFSLLAKKKNPLLAILSILALEGGTSLLLMAHMQDELKSIQLTDAVPAESAAVPEESITVEDANGNEVPAEE